MSKQPPKLFIEDICVGTIIKIDGVAYNREHIDISDPKQTKRQFFDDLDGYNHSYITECCLQCTPQETLLLQNHYRLQFPTLELAHQQTIKSVSRKTPLTLKYKSIFCALKISKKKNYYDVIMKHMTVSTVKAETD